MLSRILPILSLLLVANLSVPLAAALAEDDAQVDVATEESILCGVITEMGVIPWTICVAITAACITWRLLWGQSAPCPIVTA